MLHNIYSSQEDRHVDAGTTRHPPQEARERAGLTQEEVARSLGLRARLSRSWRREAQSIRAGTARLAYYMALACGISRPEFAIDGISVLLRALPETDDDEGTRDAIRKGIAIAREIANLEHLLEVERATAAFPRYPAMLLRGRWEAVDQGKRLAHQERQRLELGSAPLDNLGDLMENQGITVLELELPNHLSGFTVRLNESVVCGVNVTHVAERQRFSLAHEYCHVLVDHDRPGIISRQEEKDELSEVRANAFAAAFLMPEDGIRDYLSRLNKGLPSRPREAVVPLEGDVSSWRDVSGPGHEDRVVARLSSGRSLPREPAGHDLAAFQSQADHRAGTE